MKQKIENYLLLKNSVNLQEMTWIRIHFFPVRIRIKIKWNKVWFLSNLKTRNKLADDGT